MLRYDIRGMSDEEICTYYIEQYKADHRILRKMRNLYAQTDDDCYHRPVLDRFYEFVLTSDGEFTERDAINLYDTMPYDQPEEFWNAVKRNFGRPNTQMLIQTCYGSTNFLSYLYESLEEEQIVSVASSLTERISYLRQIRTFLNHKEEIYEEDFRIISLLCRLGSVPLSTIRDEYEAVEQYLEEQV